MENEVRVRFAPSPTGPLHMGGVRTALYNYLFARKHQGTLLLRIEDTDQARYVKGAEEYIEESLAWCGISIDEGVGKGGPFAPYRQSERKEIYRDHAMQLVRKGLAYYAFDTPEALDQMRKKQEESKSLHTGYHHGIRHEMKNSISLPTDEVNRRIASGEDYVIRFKIPENELITFTDEIRGEIEVRCDTLDDKVIFKSDGLPTYHLANVTDDYLMRISHVIRGEEWLPSTPLHILLYRAFEWDMPVFAHLPLILKPSGKGKLSKRDGDKMGFPVFPIEWKSPEGEVYTGYREEGYLPEAFVNLLALLGWNPGSEQELFSQQELIREFSLDRVGKGGATFNPDKAKWFNHQYIQQRSVDELAGQFARLIEDKGIQADWQRVTKVTALVKERISFVPELWDQAWYFFRAPGEYDPKDVKKRWKSGSPEVIREIYGLLENAEPFTEEHTETLVKEHIQSNELGMGQVLNALRICLVGAARGPHLFTIMEILGREEVLKRIDKALQELG